MAVTQLLPAPVGLTNELVLEFFLVFSRFEYAMKAAGWTRPDRTAAEPDWQRLIREIQTENHAVAAPIVEAGQYLLLAPPKQQVRRPDGGIGWSEVECNHIPEQVACLLRSVKRVRNNLFHGGKFERLTELSDRRTNLVVGSLRVLECLLEQPACSAIREKYFEYADSPD
jgi:hypothetical protein